MRTFVAAFPMYDWPEVRQVVDADWAGLRDRLRAAGVTPPDRLTRRNADLPAVAGGIRNAEGIVIAPDPSSLPPEDLDLPTLWRHPDLLIAQTCWGPMQAGLQDVVHVIGQPSYDGFEGGSGPLYSSAVLMRRRDGTADPHLPAFDIPAPPDGRPYLPVAALSGRHLAYNAADSRSGVIALERDLERAEGGGLFRERTETGSHRGSIIAVAEGKADVCAVDCRSWYLAKRFEPRSAALRVVGWTGLRKGLPLIASMHLPAALIAALKAALALN